MNASKIVPIPKIAPLDAQTKVQPKGAANQPGATITHALDALSQTQGNSDALIQKLAAGENVDLHQVMIATEQTDISFKVALAMRDKLVEAYQEMMRMAV